MISTKHPIRLAIVQHGDYYEAYNIWREGMREPYSGMHYSVKVVEDLLNDHQFLMINLGTSEHYTRKHRNGTIIGFPPPHKKLGMKSLGWRIYERRVVELVKRFGPSHMLLRTAGPMATKLLNHCNPRGISTLGLMANLFRDTVQSRRLAAALAHPSVHLVGNHRKPATMTMVAAGVPESKAVAYDWRSADPRLPSETPPKRLGPPPYNIFFAGNMIEAKGVGDLIEAVGRVHAQGVPISLTAAGDGVSLPTFKQIAAKWNVDKKVIHLPGRIPNVDVQAHMRASTLVCVPSHHSFPEGLPQTLTEGLLARTPVIASDHPILVDAFIDNEGIRFFRASDPSELARVILETLHDPNAYSELSAATARAYERVACGTLMGELIDNWVSATFSIEKSSHGTM